MDTPRARRRPSTSQREIFGSDSDGGFTLAPASLARWLGLGGGIDAILFRRSPGNDFYASSEKSADARRIYAQVTSEDTHVFCLVSDFLHGGSD